MYQLIFSELLSGGSAFIPGTIFKYSNQLNLDIEDLGFLSILFYYLSNNNELNTVTVENVRRIVPDYSIARLKKRIQHLVDLGFVTISNDSTQKYLNQIISVEPLLEKLGQIYLQEHPELDPSLFKTRAEQECEKELIAAKNEIILLNRQLKQVQELTQGSNKFSVEKRELSSDFSGYKEVEKYITNYTGELLSSGMALELKKWLFDFKVDTKFLIAILELCFDHNIQAPHTITKYVEDITDHDIHTLEQLEEYFKRFVATENSTASIPVGFDLELLELAKYLNIDMKAEARKQLYYKWRNEWGFSHAMIMKAGEIMSTRVNQGGLEYMDRILNNWKNAGINSLEAVAKSQQEFQSASSKNSNNTYFPKTSDGHNSNKNRHDNYSSGNSNIYIPRNLLNKKED